MSAALQEKLVQEIMLFMRYAVPEHHFDRAAQLVESYRDDLMILKLLREHYSLLPGDIEEAVEHVFLVAHKQGIHLIVVSTDSSSSLYLVSMEHILWLGEYGEEVDNEVVEYFDYKSQKAFLKDCKSVDQLREYRERRVAKLMRCPVCHVHEGESHLFGCVVELCPWCGGQLSVCNCRFDQLKTEEIEDEVQLQEFLELLEAKGRIPFAKNQMPAYPGTSEGLDV